jgi:hypothetical protein
MCRPLSDRLLARMGLFLERPFPLRHPVRAGRPPVALGFDLPFGSTIASGCVGLFPTASWLGWGCFLNALFLWRSIVLWSGFGFYALTPQTERAREKSRARIFCRDGLSVVHAAHAAHAARHCGRRGLLPNNLITFGRSSKSSAPFCRIG